MRFHYKPMQTCQLVEAKAYRVLDIIFDVLAIAPIKAS